MSCKSASYAHTYSAKWARFLLCSPSEYAPAKPLGNFRPTLNQKSLSKSLPRFSRASCGQPWFPTIANRSNDRSTCCSPAWDSKHQSYRVLITSSLVRSIGRFHATPGVTFVVDPTSLLSDPRSVLTQTPCSRTSLAD